MVEQQPLLLGKPMKRDVYPPFPHSQFLALGREV